MTERGERGGEHRPLAAPVKLAGGERVEPDVHPVYSGPDCVHTERLRPHYVVAHYGQSVLSVQVCPLNPSHVPQVGPEDEAAGREDSNRPGVLHTAGHDVHHPTGAVLKKYCKPSLRMTDRHGSTETGEGDSLQRGVSPEEEMMEPVHHQVLGSSNIRHHQLLLLLTGGAEETDWEDPPGSSVQPEYPALGPAEVETVSRDPRHEDCGGVGQQVQQADVLLPGVEEPHLTPGHPAARPALRVLPVAGQAGAGVAPLRVPAHLRTRLRRSQALVNV